MFPTLVSGSRACGRLVFSCSSFSFHVGSKMMRDVWHGVYHVSIQRLLLWMWLCPFECFSTTPRMTEILAYVQGTMTGPRTNKDSTDIATNLAAPSRHYQANEGDFSICARETMTGPGRNKDSTDITTNSAAASRRDQELWWRYLSGI